MNVYLLFYDKDTGAREEWNTFYTPVEIFLDPKDRDLRKKQLLQQDPDLEFHELDEVAK